MQRANIEYYKSKWYVYYTCKLIENVHDTTRNTQNWPYGCKQRLQKQRNVLSQPLSILKSVVLHILVLSFRFSCWHSLKSYKNKLENYDAKSQKTKDNCVNFWGKTFLEKLSYVLFTRNKTDSSCNLELRSAVCFLCLN